MSREDRAADRARQEYMRSMGMSQWLPWGSLQRSEQAMWRIRAQEIARGDS